ncbi:MAG TPA: hypothetical protein VKY85_24960 [Candidatus Angelobacter sp.]|nr:hypothetical protein [Candidatus Angelobacter sp.]
MSTKEVKQSTTGWKSAIEDAQRRIDRLKGVIAACEEKIEKGEPWPGNEKAGTADAIPAH